MLLRSMTKIPVLRLLAPAALSLLAGLTATGCGGCNENSVTCDSNNNCTVCDAYGCYPAGSGVGGSSQGGGGGGPVGSGGTGGGGVGGGGGGGSSCDPATSVCPCDADGMCPDGLSCADGLCVSGCDFGYECGPGKVCANGQCLPGCSDNAPCAEAGTVCENGVCVPDPANPACDDQTPCPVAGEICVNGICATPCDANDDCPTGEVCNASTGACIPDPSPLPSCSSSGTTCGGVGQVCMDDGYCHYPCSDVNACKLIDNRFDACDQGVCKTDEEVSPECTSDMPCPAGQDCINNHCL